MNVAPANGLPVYPAKAFYRRILVLLLLCCLAAPAARAIQTQTPAEPCGPGHPVRVVQSGPGWTCIGCYPTSSVELDPLNLVNLQPIVFDGEIQAARTFEMPGNPQLISTRFTLAISRIFRDQDVWAGANAIQFTLSGGAWLDSSGICWVERGSADELHVGEHVLILGSARSLEQHEVPAFLIADSNRGGTEILDPGSSDFHPYRRYSLDQVKQIMDDVITWRLTHPACDGAGDTKMLISTDRIALPNHFFQYDYGFPEGEGYSSPHLTGSMFRKALVEGTIKQVSTFLPHKMGPPPIDTYERPIPVFTHVVLQVSAVTMGQEWLSGHPGTIAMDTPGGIATDDWKRCEVQLDAGMLLHPGERVRTALYMRTDGRKFWAPSWAWWDLDTGKEIVNQFPWTAIRPCCR